jgi:hypothetical protein
MVRWVDIAMILIFLVIILLIVTTMTPFFTGQPLLRLDQGYYDDCSNKAVQDYNVCQQQCGIDHEPSDVMESPYACCVRQCQIDLNWQTINCTNTAFR